MLISKIPDNEGGHGESVAVPEQDSDSHEYQTANELFELMAKNQNFDTADVDKLTTRDLVLLYKNIDLGTQLMSNANELKRRKPNQHVESVVYNDESDSDVSERLSSEELGVLRLNDERLDLLAAPSVDNTLCHKLGDLKMKTSNLATDYDNHFLFKDPYINEQLKCLKLMNKTSDFEGAVLPASLLDYISCKRLEDNYNFYMDNIIRYVRNTIDQLKRISNGDYLTDKAKEKWREVEQTAEDLPANTKVLATSTSIPLHVERKITGGSSTWDDIVHSAVDIRSLSKILEKKIVVEVPKLLCGPYKILSKCCADNLIISCKKDKRPVEERVDVMLKLQRSVTGHVISNINSIMILQTAPVARDTLGEDLLPLPTVPYIEETNNKNLPENKPKIIELEQTVDETAHAVSVDSDCSIQSSENPIENSYLNVIDYASSDNDGATSSRNSSCQESSNSSVALKDILDRKLRTAQKESSPDDLRMTIRKLTLQSAVTEESGEEMSQSTSKKKKSPTRVRIKSPYENQSYIMEEKKRRKLLEIRERRERKKMALAENCKITKHKYPKGSTLPQSASSVTKLSISNKSFYNSIYGQANADPSKQAKERNRKGGKRDVLDINIEDNEGEHDASVASTPDKDNKKYINRSYYLDNADTEMMYIDMKQNENDAKDLCSTSTSVISNVFQNNLNYLSQLIGPSESDLNIGDDELFSDKDKPLSATKVDDINDESACNDLLTNQSILKVPVNTPKTQNLQDNPDPKKLTYSVECRKSIDKLYNLVTNLGKSQETENKSTKGKLVLSIPKKVDEKEGRTNSTCPGSESGTSLKHHIASSNPSSFSFNKNNSEKPNNTHNKKPGSLSPVIPKVIISSKSPTPKPDLENNRKNHKRSVTSPIKKIPDNPLKAISQLLHEFDNVQKNRQKSNTEHKHVKKTDLISVSDGKSVSRKISLKRRSRLDQHNASETERFVRLSTPKEKKSRQQKEMDSPKVPLDDKQTEKPARKKTADISDEAKEARGEAVRGPSFFKLNNSRLNSLAQPKKSYVQAHSEEYQTKYGRTLMADRLQRLAATPHSLDRPAGTGNTRSKVKRSGTEPVPAAGALKSPSPVPSPERVFRARQSRSRSSSPAAKERLSQGMGSSFKQVSVPETPQTLKKKMVAVGSYVKNHYGRARPMSSPVTNDTRSAQKSRVPLLPNDIELASSTSSALTTFQESTELGSRLHNIISSIMRTTTTQGLEVLPECRESTSLAENTSKPLSSNSDYVLDIMDDNNVITSVGNADKASEIEQKQTNFGKTGALQNDLQPVRSVAELAKLENALCNHIPVGSFHKRLRIKTLTMTPKQSIQNVFVLQSGDTGSLVVQTQNAQNMTKKSSDTFSECSVLPKLSKSHINWNFADFPMKISTVGYAFPDYKPINRSSNSLIQIFDETPKQWEEEKSLPANHKIDKGCHNPEGAEPIPRFEQAAQVNFLAASTLVTVGISTSTTHFKELDRNQKIIYANATNAQPMDVFIERSQNKTMEDTLNGQQTQTHSVIGNKENVSLANKPEDIEFTTSLDILVGLLNEIQNISTCQTQMTKGDKIPSENQQSKVLETLLINEAAALGPSLKSSRCDVVSLTSLERLRQLESNPSLYSFYLSDEGSEHGRNKLNFPSGIIHNYTNDLLFPKRIYVDKEVGADFIDREAVNKLTDVPSKLHAPQCMSHSAGATHSLIKVLSEPSIQSTLFAECSPVDSNVAPLDHKSVISVQHILITTESKQSLDFYDVETQLIEMTNENKSHIKITESFEKEKVKTMRKAKNGKFRFKTEFDPIMKMKRDILVTVYSILVFTVFAALSFPEMLYRI